MGWVIERHDLLESTMDVADERARAGAPAGLVVVAEHQTKGRGQRGRVWLDPPGSSLLMTIVARPDCSPRDLPDIPELIGQHVAAAISRFAGLRCSVKPPNDVLVDGRKLAGILCQSSIESERVRYMLVGIGINANVPAADLPVAGATSMLEETGRRTDLGDLLELVLDELAECWCFEAVLECR